MFGAKGLITSALFLMVFVIFEGYSSVQVYNMMQTHTEKPSLRDQANAHRSYSLRERTTINNKERVLHQIKEKSNKVTKTTSNNHKQATKSKHVPNESKPLEVHEQTGTEANLPCNVSHLEIKENTLLKWVKLYDKTSEIPVNRILTASVLTRVRNPKNGPKLYWNDSIVTEDKRFKSEMDENEKNWWLHIRYTQNADEGLYQCQIYSKDPERLDYAVNVTLELVEAYAEISGDSVICINDMKPLRLSCVLKNSTERPEYIFWYKDDIVINWDLGDNAHVRNGDKGSELIFAKPNKSNNGNYTCVPSNARQASVYIRYEVDLPSTCELPQEIAGAGGGIPVARGGDIVNMLGLILTFHLRR